MYISTLIYMAYTPLSSLISFLLIQAPQTIDIRLAYMVWLFVDYAPQVAPIVH